MPAEAQGPARRFVETDAQIHAFDKQIADISKQASRAKFESYTLPGEKSNYTEMLMRMPQKTTSPLSRPELLTELSEGYDPIHDSHQPEGSQWGITPPGQASARPWAGRWGTPEAATDAALKQLNANRFYEWG